MKTFKKVSFSSLGKVSEKKPIEYQEEKQTKATEEHGKKLDGKQHGKNLINLLKNDYDNKSYYNIENKHKLISKEKEIYNKIVDKRNNEIILWTKKLVITI